MSLRRRTALLSLVTIVLVIIGSLVLALGFSDEVGRQSLLTDRLEPAVVDANSLRTENAQVATSITKYVVTGDADERQSVMTSLAESTRLLRSLERLLAYDPGLRSAGAKVARAQATWMSEVLDPILVDMGGGRPKDAAARVDSSTFDMHIDELDATTAGVIEAIERARSQGLSDLRGITRDLGIALALSGLLAIGLTVFTMLALRAWVLAPLDRVRADLRQAAAQTTHETPIEQSGPTEIAELAGDAEALRRELLREIDAASAARSSLEHSAPVVVALQEAMSPLDFSPPLGIAFHGRTRAAEGVIAGDWWDAIPLESGALAVVIADVSGHDLEAGVVAVGLRSVVRTGLLSGLEPHDVMGVASRELRSHGRAVTAFIAIIEPDSGQLRWANAGHHPPLILRSDTPMGSCEATGPLMSPLGGSWRTSQMPFNTGDVCFAFTDGLIESLDADGAELGAQGLSSLLERIDSSLRADLPELTERVVSRARLRAQSWSADDITILAFARTP